MKNQFVVLFLACGLLAANRLQADPINLPDPYNILNQPRLAGEFLGCRPKAETNGVVLSAQSISDLLGNTSGGASTGTTYSGLINLGLALDLQKAVGWEGASFKNTWLWLYGNNGNNLSASNIRNALNVSSIAGQPAFRCYELWFQQNAFQDRVSLRGGLIPVDTEFMVSDTASLFVNSTFGAPAFFTMNIPNGGPTYPMATPGLRLAIQPTSWLTLRTVFTQANPFDQTENLHGFDWNFGSAGGLLNITEAEADWNKGDAAKGLPGYAKLGLWFQRGQGSQQAEAQGYNFSSPEACSYNNGFYGIIDQKLYAPNSTVVLKDAGKESTSAKETKTAQEEPIGASAKGLSSFARIGFSPNQTSVVGFYSDMGLVYTGLLPTRDADKFGLAFSYAQVGTQQLQNAAIFGPSGASFEGVAELSYSIRVAPAIAIQPDIQYILHPGGTQQYGNALVVGARAVVDF